MLRLFVSRTCHVRRVAAERRFYAMIPLSEPSHRLSAGTQNAQKSLKHDEEVTVYVKGFLASGEAPDHFEDWFQGHRQLVTTKGWSAHAKGFFWMSGHPSTPAPILSAAALSWNAYRAVKVAKSFHPLTLAAGIAADAAVWTGRLAYEYIKANRHAQAHAYMLAEDIHLLKRRYSRIRLVAHSLGCKITVAAMQELSAEDRPDELHLMAAALTEEEARQASLGTLATDTFIYYAPRDFTLSTLFPILHGIGSPAVGSSGLSGAYDRVYSVCVDEHFGMSVHTEYRKVFHRFVLDREDIKKKVEILQ